MAKVILKTNLATSNYYVEHKVINTPLNEIINISSTELIITPISGYVIDASDFRGSSSPYVRSISFTNSGKKIIAEVFFNSFKVSQDIINISLLISGLAKLPASELNITQSMSIDENIIATGTSDSKIKISGALGSEKLVLRKSFNIPDGYKYKNSPTYKISGNSQRYTVNRSQKGNNYIFNIFYTFPSQDTVIKSNDFINFSASSELIKTNIKDVIYTDNKEDHKIYSINTGSNSTSRGGIKRITIKGVPGTPFKILTQDTDKNVYNFKTGNFTNGGFLEGIIPNAKPGVGYGVFKSFIQVPISSAANTIDTRILSDVPVTTFGVEEAGSEKTIKTDVSVIKQEVITSSTLTLELKDTGITDANIFRHGLIDDDSLTADIIALGGIADGTYSVGPGQNGLTISDLVEKSPILDHNGNTMKRYQFVVRPDINKYIRICRKPVYSSVDDFAVWGGDTSDDRIKKLLDTNGKTITMDWDNVSPATLSDNWRIKDIKTDVVGSVFAKNATIDTVDYPTWDKIIISVTIIGTFGTTDINPELRLYNILEVH